MGHEDAVEGREVKVGRGHQGDEALHQGLCSQRKGLALLRRVLVPAILEPAEPRLGDRPASSIANEALEALPVVALDGDVGVEGEAQAHRDASATR